MPSPLSVVRPAGVALLLLAAVGATAAALYAYWPAGVAVGVALGAGAVLAIGARMQVSERRNPVDAELAATLGLAPVESASVESAPVESAPVEPAATAAEAPAVRDAAAPAPAVRTAAPALHAQPDVLYFTSDDDPDAVEVREVVTGANDIVVIDDQEPAPVEPAPREAADVEAAPEVAEAESLESGVADAEPLPGAVRSDLERLKAELGDDYRDFARAARLVVSTQYASAARLQRDLALPYSRARRLLTDLEQQHFVGPATGSLPRQVLLPKERLPEVEQLLAEV
ncbi:DNA translocase FtsK [Amnibacterium kyonggiense]